MVIFDTAGDVWCHTSGVNGNSKVCKRFCPGVFAGISAIHRVPVDCAGLVAYLNLHDNNLLPDHLRA